MPYTTPGFEYSFFSTPTEIREAYDNGFVGSRCDADGIDDEIRSTGSFGDVYSDMAHIQGIGEGKLILPFIPVYQYDPTVFYDEPQGTGDCVSHGIRNACYYRYILEIHALNQAENLPIEYHAGRFATEAIYGSRNNRGQGMDCSTAINFVTTKGGLLLRKKYEFGDFSKYNASYAASLGGGMPEALYAEAKLHQCTQATKVNSTEQLRDLLAANYFAPCCSGQGFSATRNEDGVSNPQGSWSHCMPWIGCDDTDATKNKYGGMLFLLFNGNWGKWNSGPTKNLQPPGSMWVREKTVRSMISAGGTFAVSGINGWTQLPQVYSF